MTDLIIIVALLAANGFFVAAEFALVKARGYRLSSLATEGRFGAELTVRIQLRLESYLAACQLGITMASLGLGWVGEPAVEALLHPLFEALELTPQMAHTVAFLTGFIIFSSLHIVVGEQVPKTFAIREPEPVSLWCAYPLHVFYVLAFPLNWALTVATSAILRMFGVEEATHGEVLTGEEFEALAVASGEHGGITSEKATMVANLFAFDLRPVGRVMIPRVDVVLLDATAPAVDNLRIMRESGHSRFPLLDGEPNRPVGVVLAKELYDAALGDGSPPWDRLLEFVREPVIVPEILRLPELFDVMRQHRKHMAFVVDEYGEFVGLVTLEDLLEEIVGEIDDETDEPDVDGAHEIIERDGGYETDGLATLADLSRSIGLRVDTEIAANTLSGLIVHQLQRIAVDGDEVTVAGFRIRVLSMRDNHADRVFIVPEAGTTYSATNGSATNDGSATNGAATNRAPANGAAGTGTAADSTPADVPTRGADSNGKPTLS